MYLPGRQAEREVCAQGKLSCIPMAGELPDPIFFYLHHFLAALLVILLLDKVAWIQHWAWLVQEVGPELSCGPHQPRRCCDRQSCVLMNSHEIHKTQGNLAALCGKMGQSSVPASLYVLSICSPFSHLGGNTQKEEIYSKYNLPDSLWWTLARSQCKLKRQSGCIHLAFSCSTPGIVQERAQHSESWYLARNAFFFFFFGAPRRWQSHLCWNFQLILLSGTDEPSMSRWAPWQTPLKPSEVNHGTQDPHQDKDGAKNSSFCSCLLWFSRFSWLCPLNPFWLLCQLSILLWQDLGQSFNSEQLLLINVRILP